MDISIASSTTGGLVGIELSISGSQLIGLEIQVNGAGVMVDLPYKKAMELLGALSLLIEVVKAQ
jgi:hypothetical protein